MAVKKKQKFTVEFQMRSSPKILYGFLSTASGLEEWFAEKVTINENIYTFHWEGSDQRAKIVHKRENQMVRFKWLDDPDDAFIEFDIQTDDLTSDVALIISDFALPEDKDETAQLWDTQIHNLRQIIGS
jgi:hypothetical protein